MSQAHSRGDASLDVQDDLTADDRARARTGAPGERDAARRHRATPAPDLLVLRHRRRADRARLRGDSGAARRGLDPQGGLGHGRNQRVAADAVSERVQRADAVRALPHRPGKPPREPGRVDSHERHREEQEQHVGEDADQTREQVSHQRGDDGHRESHRRTSSAQDPGQRMHTDHKDERLQDGPDDRGELPQRQSTGQNPGSVEHNAQRRALIPRGLIVVFGSVTRQMCRSGIAVRHHADQLNPEDGGAASLAEILKIGQDPELEVGGWRRRGSHI
jgi:hypothetical protein